MTDEQLLRACLEALNLIPNTRLNSEPLGCRNTYELAALVDNRLKDAAER